MVQSTVQEITVAFDTEQSLQQAQEKLQEKALPSAAMSRVMPKPDTVPKKRMPSVGGLKAAGLGGLIGAIVGAAIIGVAQNIPNFSSIYNNAVPLFTVTVLAGLALGGGAGGLSSFFAGAALDQAPAKYRLVVKASSEEIKTATATLLDEGGRLI
ncbi:MAG: hypothetical protein ACFB16_15245 [Phormidesmis sp.]